MVWKLANFKFREPKDSGDEKLLADVQRHGWHIVGVPADREGPGFAFTVGLYLRTLQPEILIMGLPIDRSGQILNTIGDFLVNGGDLTLERRYTEFVEEREVIFRQIAKHHYRDYLGYANWFYRFWPAGFPAVQCFWPDTNGAFPHESGFEEKFRGLQTDLST